MAKEGTIVGKDLTQISYPLKISLTTHIPRLYI